jgi:hypothetical protein
MNQKEFARHCSDIATTEYQRDTSPLYLFLRAIITTRTKTANGEDSLREGSQVPARPSAEKVEQENR